MGNDNVCSICHRLRDIDSGIVHDLDLELQNRPRSNVNMPIELPYATLYLLTIEIIITYIYYALSSSVMFSQPRMNLKREAVYD